MSEESENFADIKFHRHHFIKTFYLIYRHEIFNLYRKVTGSMDILTPLAWNSFVNSKELHDFVYARVTMLSDWMLDAIAYGEILDNIGMEMHTEDGVIYIAMPLLTHDNLRIISDQTGANRQQATRCFITMLCHMFFRDLYGKPFKIFKEKEGWMSLTDNYQYEEEDWS